MGESQMNVLILTGHFGQGHFSAAQTLGDEIRRSFSDVNITLRDIFEYTIPNYSSRLYQGYTLLVNRAGKLYNWYYKFTENWKRDIHPPFCRYFQAKLKPLIAETKPDMIVSTLPFCSQLVSQYNLKNGQNIPLITCITDVSTHREWINPGTTMYLVPCEAVRQNLIEKGIAPGKVFISGIPVQEQFKANVHPLAKDGKHLLIMGGGLGMLPRAKSFYQGLNGLKDVKTTIITGKNRDLYQRIHGRYENIEVVGYTDQVYRYMQEADLVISKPGGITLFETIFSELPILVFSPYLQQEIKNAAFIENQKIGLVLPTRPEDCVEEIERVIHNDTQLERLRANMQTFKAGIDSDAILKIVTGMRSGLEVRAS